MLLVPFIDQWGPDATEPNDCAAACGVMLLGAYGIKGLTVNEFFRKTGQRSGLGLFLSGHVRKVLEGVGLPCEYHQDLQWGQMQGLIQQRRPFLTQINGASIGHVVLVRWMDDGAIWFNDPAYGLRKWGRTWYAKNHGRYGAVLVPVSPLP